LLVLVLTLSMVVEVVRGGCRWSNPTWVQSEESAPILSISTEQVLTVRWGRNQFAEKFDCADKFDVVVEHKGVERRLCSKERIEGLDNYSCKLDLSNPKHCNQVFTVYVSAVNLNHSRGAQITNTFYNSVLTVRCEALSEINKVVSSSCHALSPTWTSPPNISTLEFAHTVRFDWDRSHVENLQCVNRFILKLWEASSFSPKYITQKISMTDIRDSFGVRVELTECKAFTYILSAVTDTGRAVDSQGELRIACPEDVFDDENDIEKDIDNIKDDDNNLEDDGDNDRSYAARSLTAKQKEKSVKDDIAWQAEATPATSSQDSARMSEWVASVKSSAHISTASFFFSPCLLFSLMGLHKNILL